MSPTSTTGDRCTSCEAPLAPDQHYCINCGERRGKARLSFAEMTSQSAPPPDRKPPSEPPRHQRMSSGVGLIAGIATLLLAMGVGVLIGHNSSSGKVTTQAADSPAPVIKVEGGGSGNSGSGGGGGGGTSHHAKKVKHTTRTTATRSTTTSIIPAAPPVTLSKKQTQAANSAAGKVLGSGSKNLAPSATVQPGQACTHGAGCQNGKFTGVFFNQ
jgi:hypothetical protein